EAGGRGGWAAWGGPAVVGGWGVAGRRSELGFARSGWSCAAVGVVLRDDHAVPVGGETVRRWLRAAGLVWRRPRPVLRPKDPERDAKLAALRRVLRGLPAGERAAVIDEVGCRTNPEVGRV